MKIKEIQTTFTNGDVLTLSLRENSTFAGYEPIDLYELTYGELSSRPNSKSSYKEDPSYYNACNTEYFPVSMEALAMQAFTTRMNCSNPVLESDLGLSLDSFLIKK